MMCDVDPREYRPGTDEAVRDQIVEIFMRAVGYAAHEQKTVRIMAAGTMAAIDWVVGNTSRPPLTRGEVLLPTLADIGVEYEAVLQAKAQSEDRVAFANDVGVVDVLRYLVNPYGGIPWWASIPDPLPSGPRAGSGGTAGNCGGAVA